MSLLYVVVLAVIVVVLLAVALYRTSQVKTKADYLVAGRSLPAVVLVLTLLTSWIGAGSLFAGAENAYKNGFAAITSYQFRGGGDVLHLIFPDVVTPELGTFIIAAFVIITTAMAGMSSVAYMDVAIWSLVTVICVIAAPYLFLHAGGWNGLHASLPPQYFQVLGNYRLGPDHVQQSVGMGLIRALEFLVPTMLRSEEHTSE